MNERLELLKSSDYQETIDHKLYEAFVADEVDYSYVESLLKDGANPLDGYLNLIFSTETESWDENNCCIVYKDDRKVVLTKLFLKYGLLDYVKTDYDIDGEEYDDLPVTYVFEDFGDQYVLTLKMILDEGYEGPTIKDLVDDFFFDIDFIFDIDLRKARDRYNMEWGLKRIMLIASYPNLREKYEVVTKYIEVDSNDVSVLDGFRDIDKYDYTIERMPNSEWWKAIIKDGDNVIWKMKF